MLELGQLPSLPLLRAFQGVAETGSGSAAASRLMMSQPAISYAVSRLEEQLAIKLFTRAPSGSNLTSAGHQFHVRTTRLFAQLSEALRVATAQHVTENAGADQLSRKLRGVHVKVLIGIWRSGGFRAAARDLGIADPSLQRPARELERILRVSLFKRGTNGLEINGVGAELARRLSLAFGEIWSGIEDIGATARAERASVRIGVLALAPRNMLAQALNAFVARNNHLRVEVIEGAYAEHASSLSSGDIDLIFGALRSRPTSFNFIEHPLFEDPYVLVCGANHPLAKMNGAGPRDLANCKFILPSRGLPRREVLDRVLTSWNVQVDGTVETSCLATIIALLRLGHHVTLLSRWHIDQEAPSQLHCLNTIAVAHKARWVGLTSRSDWLPTPYQRQILNDIRDAARAWFR